MGHQEYFYRNLITVPVMYNAYLTLTKFLIFSHLEPKTFNSIVA